jgi:hypothetical protein
LERIPFPVWGVGTKKPKPALPAKAGTHGGWLLTSTAMDPDFRQEGGLCGLIG